LKKSKVKVKVTGRQKLQEIAAYLAYSPAADQAMVAQASTAN